jgi:hypothetical protein
MSRTFTYFSLFLATLLLSSCASHGRRYDNPQPRRDYPTNNYPYENRSGTYDSRGERSEINKLEAPAPRANRPYRSSYEKERYESRMTNRNRPYSHNPAPRSDSRNADYDSRYERSEVYKPHTNNANSSRANGSNYTRNRNNARSNDTRYERSEVTPPANSRPMRQPAAPINRNTSTRDYTPPSNSNSSRSSTSSSSSSERGDSRGDR